MMVNNVSDWFQFVPLQLLSDTIEHTLHSVGGKITVFNALINNKVIGHLKGGPQKVLLHNVGDLFVIVCGHHNQFVSISNICMLGQWHSALSNEATNHCLWSRAYKPLECCDLATLISFKYPLQTSHLFITCTATVECWCTQCKGGHHKQISQHCMSSLHACMIMM